MYLLLIDNHRLQRTISEFEDTDLPPNCGIKRKRDVTADMNNIDIVCTSPSTSSNVKRSMMPSRKVRCTSSTCTADIPEGSKFCGFCCVQQVEEEIVDDYQYCKSCDAYFELTFLCCNRCGWMPPRDHLNLIP